MPGVKFCFSFLSPLLKGSYKLGVLIQYSFRKQGSEMFLNFSWKRSLNLTKKSLYRAKKKYFIILDYRRNEMDWCANRWIFWPFTDHGKRRLGMNFLNCASLLSQPSSRLSSWENPWSRFFLLSNLRGLGILPAFWILLHNSTSPFYSEILSLLSSPFSSAFPVLSAEVLISLFQW